MIISPIADAYLAVEFHGVTYTVDDLLRFYRLDSDGKWRAVSANRVPPEVVEQFREFV